jgi:oligoribonuclease
MKYLSLDIETTGINSETCQILSIGAIIEDTELKLDYDKIPKFHGAILRNEISGRIQSINLNRDLIKLIHDYTCIKTFEDKHDFEIKNEIKFYQENDIVSALYSFCVQNGLGNDTANWVVNSTHPANDITITNSKTPTLRITCAGKNFATFDKLFLEKLPKWNYFFKINQRIIDPAILFTNWNSDETLPNLSECKERAGLNSKVSHTAVIDAWDVITLLRTQY